MDPFIDAADLGPIISNDDPSISKFHLTKYFSDYGKITYHVTIKAEYEE